MPTLSLTVQVFKISLCQKTICFAIQKRIIEIDKSPVGCLLMAFEYELIIHVLQYD